jgi:hypothetical protein
MMKHNVLQAFLCLSEVSYLFYKTGFTFVWDYTKASNLLLPITTPTLHWGPTDMWELHCCKDFNMAKSPKEAFSHQILLESKELSANPGAPSYGQLDNPSSSLIILYPTAM